MHPASVSLSHFALLSNFGMKKVHKSSPVHIWTFCWVISTPVFHYLPILRHFLPPVEAGQEIHHTQKIAILLPIYNVQAVLAFWQKPPVLITKFLNTIRKTTREHHTRFDLRHNDRRRDCWGRHPLRAWMPHLWYFLLNVNWWRVDAGIGSVFLKIASWVWGLVGGDES